MKAVVATFNQEKALVGAFSVIVKTNCETDGSSAALTITLQLHPRLYTRFLQSTVLTYFGLVLDLVLCFRSPISFFNSYVESS